MADNQGMQHPTSTDDAFWQARAANAIEDNWLATMDADPTTAPVTTEDLIAPAADVEITTGPPTAVSDPLDTDAWFTNLSDDLLPDR